MLGLRGKKVSACPNLSSGIIEYLPGALLVNVLATWAWWSTIMYRNFCTRSDVLRLMFPRIASTDVVETAMVSSTAPLSTIGLIGHGSVMLLLAPEMTR